MLTNWYLYVKNWLAEQEGQDLIEYALIIVLLVVVAVVGLGLLGDSVANIWTTIKGWLDGTTTG